MCRTVDPLDYCKIILDPAWICRLRNRRRLDVMPKTASAEMDVKEVAPMVVIMRGEIKANRDEGRNISDRIGEGDGSYLH